MIIILCYIIFICLMRLVLLNKVTNNSAFIVVSGFSLFLFASFRSIYFGSDVYGYVKKYISLEYINLRNFFESNFVNEEKDIIFYFSAKIINFLGLSHNAWLAILSGVFIFTVCLIIKKYSSGPLLSFLLLIGLGYLYFSMTGLRQATAMSIILIAYIFLREKNLLRFIITVIIASLFHSTALVFLIAYPLSYLKLNIKYIFILIIVILSSFLFSDQILWLINLISWEEQYTNYIQGEQTLNYTGFIIQLIILFFCLIFKKSLLNINNKEITMYNLLVIGLIFQLLSTDIAVLFRLSLYFSIFSIILIPNVINTIKDKNLRILVTFLIIIISCFYTFWTGSFSSYDFNWND